MIKLFKFVCILTKENLFFAVLNSLKAKKKSIFIYKIVNSVFKKQNKAQTYLLKTLL